MRRLWLKDSAAILADEGGLGKTAAVIAFLQCIRCSWLA